MLLHLHRPRPPLDRFVELVTYYAGYTPDHSKERLLPDGAVEIIVDLTDTPKHTFDRSRLRPERAFQGAWISGMRKSWIAIEAAPQSSMVVVRFKPGGAYPFLGFEVEGITDTVDSLGDVLGGTAGSLRDRILEAPDVHAKMTAVEQWLHERCRGRLEQHPAVEYLTEQLFSPAGLRIADVVADVGYSQRHVLGLFRRWVGLAPKQYGRIRRFQGVLTNVVRGHRSVQLEDQAEPAPLPLREPDWADVALDHGYFDQSHLVRDFRQFAGLTPTGYLSACQGIENYLPID